MAKLTIVGSGDAFGSGGRHTACYFVEGGPKPFLLDCGATALVALKQTKISTTAFDTIFISHLHGDHFGGLPFLLIDAIYINGRQVPLTIAGPPGIEARFWQTVEAFYPTMSGVPRIFDLHFKELRVREPQEIEGVKVEAFEVRHFSGAPSYALRFDLGGKIFAFTGDTGWTDTIIEAGRGADLYLMECYQYDFRLDMHLDYQMIASQYEAIGAQRILLTHMSEAMLARGSEVDAARFMLAEDGMVVDF